MDENPDPAHPLTPPGGLNDRLDSWKEIAAHLGRGITTVQRWEQEEQLPVHRLLHAKKGTVFAYKPELDAWRASRVQSQAVRSKGGDAGPIPADSDGRGPHWRYGSLASLVAGVALTALGIGWSARATTSFGPAPVPAPMIPVPLANDIEPEMQPTLSPDGAQLAYRWLRPDSPGIYLKAIHGGTPRPLVLTGLPEASRAAYPKWSPTGDQIAFMVAENPDSRAVYAVPAAGGSPRWITAIAGTGMCWAPDGRSLAVADRNATGEPVSIFRVEIESGRRQRLTTPPPGTFGDTNCAFSSDGRRLVVARFVSRYQSDVYVQSLMGDHPAAQRVTKDFEGITGLTWAPGDREIVIGSHTGLWTIDALANDAREPAPILRMGGGVSSPAFSRPVDGRPVRFVYQSNLRDVNLWRWRGGDGRSDFQRLESSTTWYEDHPAFSPNGAHVAFASNRTGHNEIWTAPATGADARQVTFHGGPVVVSPRWSPDGQRLAFSSQIGGNRDVYVIQADGSKPVRLTWESSQDQYPSWSRDRRWIYFSSDREGVNQIWKVASGGGTAIRVTQGQASEAFESPDGTALFFVRGPDVPGVWAVPVSGGQETLIAPGVRETLWGVADRGIAFVDTTSGTSFRLFDFTSQKIVTLATLPTPASAVLPGFTVSRDAQSIVWTSLDSAKSDIMMFDPWRH